MRPIFSYVAETVLTLRRSKTRTMLITLGIMISVAAVITVLSLVDGARIQIQKSFSFTGDMPSVVVKSGRSVERSEDGKIISVDLLTHNSSAPLTKNDFETVKKASMVPDTTPVVVVAEQINDYRGKINPKTTLIATTPYFGTIISQPLFKGTYFGTEQKNTIILGKNAANELFNEPSPIGRTITIAEQTFTVGGIFESFKTHKLFSGFDMDSAVFMPIDSAEKLTQNTMILQIIVPVSDISTLEAVRQHIEQALRENRGGIIDFSVVTTAELQTVANKGLASLERFLGAIIIVVFVVGGVGIGNVVLVSVTERTKEIGIRKAIGASARQIYYQFLTEAILLSVAGVFFGVVLAAVIQYFMFVFSSLTLVVHWQVTLFALVLSVAAGIIFGTIPAIKAAKKDPIESLRQ